MIHHVFANRSNIGDWLSARGIQSLLAPEPVTEHYCDEPFVPATLGRLARATAGDLIVIGGGGLFMDYFLPFWSGFRAIADRVPFCIWGVGYCDLKREPSRAPEPLLAELVRMSRLCVLRDELSRRHLPTCALPPPVPCPSLAAVPGPPSGGRGILHVDNYTTAGPDVFELMDAYARDFADRTTRPCRRTNNRIDPPSEAALDRALRLYAESDVVLSSALHGCIIAVAMRKKVLAVSGDHKIEAFMQAAGLGDWVCDLDDTDSIPGRLDRLSTQIIPNGFVEAVRRANGSIAARVLKLACERPRDGRAPGTNDAACRGSTRR